MVPPDDPASAGAHPARQARSRRTREELVDAARALLAHRSFDDVSVGEIAGRAGVSVGGFYARFPSKEALLAELYRREVGARLARDAGDELEAESRAGPEGPDPFRVFRAYARLLLESYRRNEGLLRDAVRRGAEWPGPSSADGEAPEGGEEGAEDGRAHGSTELAAAARLREILLATPGAYAHPRPARAVRVAAAFLRAAAREAVLRGPPLDADGSALDDETLAGEWARAAAAYLTAESGAPGAGAGAAAGDEEDAGWSPFDFPVEG